MLNKEELVAFYALLVAFSGQTKMSGSQMARLFGIAESTVCRWLRMARYNNPFLHSVYHHKVAPVIATVNELNQIDADTGLYSRIAGVKAEEKVELLTKALAVRSV